MTRENVIPEKIIKLTDEEFLKEVEKTSNHLLDLLEDFKFRWEGDLSTIIANTKYTLDHNKRILNSVFGMKLKSDKNEK